MKILNIWIIVEVAVRILRWLASWGVTISHRYRLTKLALFALDLLSQETRYSWIDSATLHVRIHSSKTAFVFSILCSAVLGILSIAN